MNAEDFVRFAANGWPSISEKEHGKLSEEETLKTRGFEQDISVIIFTRQSKIDGPSLLMRLR
jgi:hypothetical protein